MNVAPDERPVAAIGAGAEFMEHRRHLFGVAYRMLGSVVEAEDVVQDAYLRWAATPRADIRCPVAWLTTVTTRLCLDRLRSARAQREAYVGPWLPEPLVTNDNDPAVTAELSDSLTTAFLVLLERLNPLERAAFLLHDVFGYRFEEIGEIVERPPATCRQAASRARSLVTSERRGRFEADPDREGHLILAFLEAAGAGDVDTLVSLLARDVVVWSDGGSRRHAARRPVVGPARVARYCANLAKRMPAEATMRMLRIGADPGILVVTPTGPFLTVAFDVGPEGIRSIHVVVNPEKLTHLHDTHLR